MTSKKQLTNELTSPRFLEGIAKITEILEAKSFESTFTVMKRIGKPEFIYSSIQIGDDSNTDYRKRIKPFAEQFQQATGKPVDIENLRQEKEFLEFLKQNNQEIWLPYPVKTKSLIDLTRKQQQEYYFFADVHSHPNRSALISPQDLTFLTNASGVNRDSREIAQYPILGVVAACNPGFYKILFCQQRRHLDLRDLGKLIDEIKDNLRSHSIQDRTPNFNLMTCYFDRVCNRYFEAIAAPDFSIFDLNEDQAKEEKVTEHYRFSKQDSQRMNYYIGENEVKREARQNYLQGLRRYSKTRNINLGGSK